MRANPGPGKFIVVEGLDGAGTTTQACLLGERLAAKGPAWVTREPTDGPAGRLIRQVLAGDLTVDPRALALLFAADRVDHVYRTAEGIAARLKRGEQVICDRYYLSSLTYQTLDAGFSWVYRINDRVLRPDMTLFLEVPVPLCMERIGVRQGERKELFERQEALERVRTRYHRTIQRLLERELLQVIDGGSPIPQVAERVWSRVQALFEPTLLTSRHAQRQLARQEQAPYLLVFQQLLHRQAGFYLRGVRRLQHGFELQVDLPTEQEPLRVHFVRGETRVRAVVPAGQADPSGHGLARLQELAWQALEECSRG